MVGLKQHFRKKKKIPFHWNTVSSLKCRYLLTMVKMVVWNRFRSFTRNFSAVVQNFWYTLGERKQCPIFDHHYGRVSIILWTASCFSLKKKKGKKGKVFSMFVQKCYGKSHCYQTRTLMCQMCKIHALIPFVITHFFHF